MKSALSLALAAVLVVGCGERLSSPPSEAAAPVISTTQPRTERAYVSGTPQTAPLTDRAPRSAPDYKDSSRRLDTSR